MPETNASTPKPNGDGTGLSVSDAAEQIQGLFSPDPATTKKPKAPERQKPQSESEAATVEDETEVDTEAEGTDEVDPEAEDDAEDETETEAETESEDDSESEDDAEARLDQTIEFEHDGAPQKVTVRELIRGFHREADYTRKTQALAEETKNTQQEREGTRVERAAYAKLIGELETYLKGIQPKEPNWAELKATDPLEYAVQSAEWQRRQNQIQAASAERQRLETLNAKEEQEKRQQIVSDVLKKQRAKLYELLPHWRDPAKAAAEGAQVRAYAAKAGLSKEEIDQVAHTSALAIAMIRKAMLYDRAVERGKNLKPAPHAAPTTTATPGASQRGARVASELRRANQRLAKSGTLKDAAKAIELLI